MRNTPHVKYYLEQIFYEQIIFSNIGTKIPLFKNFFTDNNNENIKYCKINKFYILLKIYNNIETYKRKAY